MVRSESKSVPEQRRGRTVVVVTCEHAGREVPPPYRTVFEGHEALLASHRGWDPGALNVARSLAGALSVPLHFCTTTRLLVDLNRSIGHRQLFSELMRHLPRRQRDEIIDRYYRPHREAVEMAVAHHITAGHRVLHVASHSFTPVLAGRERLADVAWLYDPRRGGERTFAALWKDHLAQCRPDLRLRRNYPYSGRGDGLTSRLRSRHSDASYLGIELEVNQHFVTRGGAAWRTLRSALAVSLTKALAATPGATA